MYDVVVDVDVGVMDSIMEEEKKKKAACRDAGSTSCTVLYETTSHPTTTATTKLMREEDWTAGDDVRTSLLCVCAEGIFPPLFLSIAEDDVVVK